MATAADTTCHLQEYVNQDAEKQRREACIMGFGYQVGTATLATTSAAASLTSASTPSVVRNKFDKKGRTLQRRNSDEGPRRDLTEALERADGKMEDEEEEEELIADHPPLAPPASVAQPPEEAQSGNEFWSRMDCVLDRKFRNFAQDFGQAQSGMSAWRKRS